MNWFIRLITPKDWQYFNYVEDPPFWEAEYAYYRYRMCKNTGLFQRQEQHCLGLNPPEYIMEWVTLDIKPIFTIRDGRVVVKEDKQ